MTQHILHRSMSRRDSSTHRHLLTILVACALSVSVACGDNNANNDDEISSNNDTSSNTTNNGTSSNNTTNGDTAANNTANNTTPNDTANNSTSNTANNGGDAYDLANSDTLDVTGQYASSFDGFGPSYGREEITAQAWNGTQIVYADNEQNFVITEGDGDSGQFSRIVYTEPAEDGSFFYCTDPFGADSAEEAFDAEVTSDLENPTDPMSCGGSFPFTDLVPNDTIELVGMYDAEPGGGMETITADTWTPSPDSTQQIIGYNNNTNIAVLQAPMDMDGNPGGFSKNVWTEPDASGAIYYCTVASGLESAQKAWEADESGADRENPSDPMACGGSFPFTKLTVQP